MRGPLDQPKLKPQNPNLEFFLRRNRKNSKVKTEFPPSLTPHLWVTLLFGVGRKGKEENQNPKTKIRKTTNRKTIMNISPYTSRSFSDSFCTNLCWTVRDTSSGLTKLPLQRCTGLFRTSLPKQGLVFSDGSKNGNPYCFTLPYRQTQTLCLTSIFWQRLESIKVALIDLYNRTATYDPSSFTKTSSRIIPIALYMVFRATCLLMNCVRGETYASNFQPRVVDGWKNSQKQRTKKVINLKDNYSNLYITPCNLRLPADIKSLNLKHHPQ